MTLCQTTPANGHLVLQLLSLFLFSAINFEKVPFDIVEAESELIDGATTEFEGYSFSLIYAAEVLGGFLFCKLFGALCGFVILFPLLPLLGLLFIGRIFLARFLIAEISEIVLSLGLFGSLVILVIAKSVFVWILTNGDRLHKNRLLKFPGLSKFSPLIVVTFWHFRLKTLFGLF